LPFKPTPTDEASAVRGGWTQFVPKQKANATYNGLRAQFCAMPYGVRNIWGVTADILRKLYERLYS
jgi:hypothetical protein